MSSRDFSSRDRLEGSKKEVGGLIIKKKKIEGDDDSKAVFQQPSKSLLGLQKLAEEKRRLKAEDERKERDNDKEHSKRKIHESRPYRSYKPETPSHPGGVSRDAQSKIQERVRGKEKGVYADSRESKKTKKDKHSRSPRDEERKRTDYRKRDSRRRPRSPGSERSSAKTNSTRVGYEQWEDTPSRSQRSTSESPRSTPRGPSSKGIPNAPLSNLVIQLQRSYVNRNLKFIINISMFQC